MTFIWATRGRTWGFCFLRSGGFADPLPVYESALSGLQGQAEGVLRLGDRVGLRFADPEGRADRAGRIVPHDFVLFGDLASRVSTVADGLREVWPLVAAEYAGLWAQSNAPIRQDGPVENG